MRSSTRSRMAQESHARAQGKHPEDDRRPLSEVGQALAKEFAGRVDTTSASSTRWR
jgi:hypothetical protein